MIWQPGMFLVSEAPGVRSVAGYTYRGIGLYLRVPELPAWSLVHLGSGHYLTQLVGVAEKILPVATAIAECGDWEWDGIEGYRNRDPGIMDRFRAITRAHPECQRGRGAGINEANARAIAMARAG